MQAIQDGWTDESIRALRDLFIITFLYEIGVRAGELSNLGTRAMNEATKTAAAAYAITVIGKTNDRDCSFTNRTAELWRIWQQVRPEGGEEYAVIGWRRYHPPGRLYTNGISQMLERRCQSLDVPIFRAQVLRHAKVRQPQTRRVRSRPQDWVATRSLGVGNKKGQSENRNFRFPTALKKSALIGVKNLR